MRPIEFKDIDYIMAVERERSFSRAAEKEFISQPALSRIVKKVENELGFSLFDRGSFPLHVTKEGEEVFQYFRQLLAVQSELENYCEKLQREKNCEVTIGAPSYFCTYVLPSVIDNFSREYPEYRFRIIETNDNELREFLRSGVVDMGISANPDMPSDIHSVDLAEETIILAVPGSFPINEKLKGVRLSVEQMKAGFYKDPGCPKTDMAEFREEKFLFLKKGNDMYDRGMKICRDAGFVPEVVMYLDQLLSAYFLAAAGQGVTFTRASIPHYVGTSDDMYFYKINHPDVKRPVRLLMNHMGEADERLEAFSRYLREGGLAL